MSDKYVIPSFMGLIKAMTVRDYIIMGVLIALLIITVLMACTIICCVKKRRIDEYAEHKEQLIVNRPVSDNACHYHVLVVDD